MDIEFCVKGERSMGFKLDRLEPNSHAFENKGCWFVQTLLPKMTFRNRMTVSGERGEYKLGRLNHEM